MMGGLIFLIGLIVGICLGDGMGRDKSYREGYKDGKKETEIEWQERYTQPTWINDGCKNWSEKNDKKHN